MPVRFEAAMLWSHRECSLQSCRVPNGVVSGEEGCQNLLTSERCGESRRRHCVNRWLAAIVERDGDGDVAPCPERFLQDCCMFRYFRW